MNTQLRQFGLKNLGKELGGILNMLIVADDQDEVVRLVGETGFNSGWLKPEMMQT